MNTVRLEAELKVAQVRSFQYLFVFTKITGHCWNLLKTFLSRQKRLLLVEVHLQELRDCVFPLCP